MRRVTCFTRHHLHCDCRFHDDCEKKMSHAAHLGVVFSRIRFLRDFVCVSAFEWSDECVRSPRSSAFTGFCIRGRFHLEGSHLQQRRSSGGMHRPPCGMMRFSTRSFHVLVAPMSLASAGTRVGSSREDHRSPSGTRQIR